MMGDEPASKRQRGGGPSGGGASGGTSATEQPEQERGLQGGSTQKPQEPGLEALPEEERQQIVAGLKRRWGQLCKELQEPGAKRNGAGKRGSTSCCCCCCRCCCPQGCGHGALSGRHAQAAL